MSSLMRYGIFSDVHSNLEALNKVLDAYKEESIDEFLCIGDIVGYAANPNECVDRIKETVITTVAGNHDWAAVDLFSSEYFNPVALEAVIWTAKNLNEENKNYLRSLKLICRNEDLTIVHGTLNAPENFNYLGHFYEAALSFGLMKSDICFIGHTHIPGVFIKNKNGRIDFSQPEYIKIAKENKYIVNAGSVGQPRDRIPKATYCIYDIDKKEVWIKRIEYDIESARRKILGAGLPHFLGDRLRIGF